MQQYNPFNKKVLTDIFADDEFREELIETYQNAQIKRPFSMSKQALQRQLIGLYRSLCDKSYQYIEMNQRDRAFDLIRPERIKSQMMVAAQIGLSLDPEDKEAYMETGFSGSGAVDVKIIFGIDGISIMLNSSPKVRSVSCNAVHQGDTFEWLGEDDNPVFSSPLENGSNPIIEAWGRIRLNDGTVRCSRILQSEIETVEKQQLELASYYNNQSPWEDWKYKCVRNMMLRRLFREHAKYIQVIDENIQLHEEDGQIHGIQPEDDEAVSEDDFHKLLNATHAEQSQVAK
jgi:recombinational DNA repair protein RecT